MKHNDLRRMLSLVDEKYIEELTEQASHTHSNVPHPVTKPAPKKHITLLRSLTAVAAAVVLLVPCGLLAKQVWEHRTPVQDPVQPQTGVMVSSEEPTAPAENGESQEPFASLADANTAAYPWQGRVIQAESIGAMTFDGALRCHIQYPGHEELRDAVHVVYKDPASTQHYAHVQYTRATVSELTSDPDTAIRMEELCTMCIGTSRMVSPEHADGNSAFIVNCGNYRVSVVLFGGTRQDLIGLITAVSNGFQGIAPDEVHLPEEPVDPDTAMDDLTYAQAQLFAGNDLPGAVLGWEDAGNFMTLNQIQYYQKAEEHVVRKWIVLTYEGKNGPMELTIAEPGALDAAGFADDVPVMDRDLWSMKTIIKEPYGTALSGDPNGLYDFHFRCQTDDFELMLRGNVALMEIDPFMNFYNLTVRSMSTYGTKEFGLDAVNEQTVQWKGEVITAETISDLQFRRADLIQNKLTEDSAELTFFENLYYGSDEPGSQFITISYTNASPEQLYFDGRAVIQDAPDADAILTDEWYRQGDQRAFLLQREDYYIRIMLSEDLPRETLQALIALLQ